MGRNVKIRDFGKAWMLIPTKNMQWIRPIVYALSKHSFVFLIEFSFPQLTIVKISPPSVNSNCSA